MRRCWRCTFCGGRVTDVYPVLLLPLNYIATTSIPFTQHLTHFSTLLPFSGVWWQGRHQSAWYGAGRLDEEVRYMHYFSWMLHLLSRTSSSTVVHCTNVRMSHTQEQQSASVPCSQQVWEWDPGHCTGTGMYSTHCMYVQATQLQYRIESHHSDHPLKLNLHSDQWQTLNSKTPCYQTISSYISLLFSTHTSYFLLYVVCPSSSHVYS